MYTLYYSPGACSMAPHVLLNELGVKYEAKKVDLMAGEGQKPEFLKINPRGQVPVLVDDGQVIREGAAILIHLMEKHSSPLLPKSGKERATALEWLMFGNASLHPAYGRAMFLKKNADKAAQEQLFKIVFQQINKLWAEADQRLANNPYLCGKSITAADILVTVIANWGAWFPEGSVTLGSNVKRLIKEISSRPSYKKALADEQVEYKAAA